MRVDFVVVHGSLLDAYPALIQDLALWNAYGVYLFTE